MPEPIEESTLADCPVCGCGSMLDSLHQLHELYNNGARTTRMFNGECRNAVCWFKGPSCDTKAKATELYNRLAQGFEQAEKLAAVLQPFKSYHDGGGLGPLPHAAFHAVDVALKQFNKTKGGS